MLGQSFGSIQTESWDNMVDRGKSLNGTNDPTEAENAKVHLYALEDIIVSKIRIQVDNVITTDEIQRRQQTTKN